MDAGAIAGSLEGLYGGIQAGANIYHQSQQRKMAEKELNANIYNQAEARELAKQKFGLEASAEKRTQELHEASRPSIRAAQAEGELHEKYQNKINSLYQQKELLKNNMSKDINNLDHNSALVGLLLQGSPDGIETVNESGLLTDASYVPEVDDDGKVVGMSVRGKLPGGQGGYVTVPSAQLKVYAKIAEENKKHINAPIDSIQKEIDELSQKVADIKGKGAQSAERKESTAASNALALAQYYRQSKADEAKAENYLATQKAAQEKQGLEEKKLVATEKKTETARQDNLRKDLIRELSNAGKSKLTTQERSIHYVNAATKAKEIGGVEGDELFTDVANKYVSSMIGKSTWGDWLFGKNKEKDQLDGLKEIISLATETSVSDEDASNLLRVVSNSKSPISLSPVNIRDYLVQGKVPPKRSGLSGSAAPVQNFTSDNSTPQGGKSDVVVVKNLVTGKSMSVSRDVAEKQIKGREDKFQIVEK